MSDFVPLLERHGIAVVFLCVLLEQGGLPIPAVPALLVAGALVARGRFSFVEIVAVAATASLIADVAWLHAGKRYGRKILGWVCKVSLSPDSCVRKTGAIYLRWGAKSLAVAKFIPGYSTLGPALAGIARTRLSRFVFWDGVGIVLWAGGAVLVGYLFSGAVDQVVATLESFGEWGTMLIASAFAGFVGYKFWWRQRFLRQLRMDRISVAELRQLLDEGRAPLVLDVRIYDAGAGTIPSAVRLSATDLKTIVPTLLEQGREAVLFCSCPNEVSAAAIALELKRSGVAKVRPLLGGIDAWIEAGFELEGPATA